MSANEFFLNEFLKRIDVRDTAQEWKENYIDEILSENGDYYPFKPENFQEALTEMDLGQSILLASYAHVAYKMPSESSSKNFAEYAQRLAWDYWKQVAEKKADVEYDDYTKGL
jgi:HEPN domain-containing protein